MKVYTVQNIETFNIDKIPDNAEINLNDLIVCCGDGDPKPKKDVWIPVEGYSQIKKTLHNVSTLGIRISYRIDYTPEDPTKADVAFIPSLREFLFISGKLRIRTKYVYDKIAIFSAILSLIAIIFTYKSYVYTYKTYEDQKQELSSTKNPVWIVNYNPTENTISFKSPSNDIQLQRGYVEFHPDIKIAAQSLYMPEMKVYLGELNDYVVNYAGSYVTKMKSPYSYGGNHIFERIGLATKYTYKGEIKYISSIYNLFYDVKVPGKRERKKMQIVIRGAEFLRFVDKGESLQSALRDERANNLKTREPWEELVYGIPKP